MKIKIKAPSIRNNKWSISFGHTPSKRKSAELIYRLLERRLTSKYSSALASRNKDKTQVLVIYDQRLDYTNETLKSNSLSYLLQTTARFLEDYVSKDWLRTKEKFYHEKI